MFKSLLALPILGAAAVIGACAQPVDRLVVGSMSQPAYQNLVNLPLPDQPGEKFCTLAKLAANVLAWAYVPSASERSGDFSSFPGDLIDPASGSPFPGNIIPLSRIPGTFAWRIAPTGPATSETCVSGSGLPQFDSVAYVSGLAPNVDSLLVDQSGFDQQYQLGDPIPTLSLISVTSGGQPLSFNVDLVEPGNGALPPSWLKLKPTAGCCVTTPAQLSLELSPASLLPGSYQALVRITAINAISDTKEVPVAVVVTAPPDWLLVRQSRLDFTYTLQDADPPEPKTIDILSLGNSATSFTATAVVVTPPNSNWLSVNPTSGDSATSLSVSIDFAALQLLGRGSYVGYIDITAEGARNSPQRVMVFLSVFPDVDFTITPQNLIFDFPVNGQLPAAQKVSVDPVPNPTTDFSKLSFNLVITMNNAREVPWVTAQPSPTAIPHELEVSLTADALKLQPGDHNAVIAFEAAGGSDNHTGGTIPVTVTIPPGGVPQPSPIIKPGGVLSVAAAVPGLSPGSWIAIYGNNFATNTRTWNEADFTGNQLPTQLDGVAVTVDGKPAAVYYVSPKQIDAQVPDSAMRGSVPVTVSKGNLTSAPIMVTLQDYAPAFFQSSGAYAVALHRDFSPVGKAGTSANATPAKPGEIILLWGTGFGPSTPAAPIGLAFTGKYPLPSLPSISIGGASAEVHFAGIVGPGLYQFNVLVPELADGDRRVTAAIGGRQTQANVFIPIQH